MIDFNTMPGHEKAVKDVAKLLEGAMLIWGVPNVQRSSEELAGLAVRQYFLSLKKQQIDRDAHARPTSSTGGNLSKVESTTRPNA